MKPKISRRAQRYPVNLKVKEINGRQVADTYVVDISTSGARLECPVPLKPQDRIKFTFHQPNEDSETKLAGVVVWVKPVPEKTGRYHMGVEFHSSLFAHSPAARARSNNKTREAAHTSLVSFLGSKGGVGNTFLTINVAYLLAREKVGRVLVVDLDLLYGQARYFFDAKPKHTIVDVIENFKDLDDSYLKSLLHNYDDYLSLLPAPVQLEDAESVTPGRVKEILQYIQDLQTFKWIFLDCPHQLGEVAMMVLESSDDIFLTTAPFLPALHNARKLMKLLEILGQGRARVAVILNSAQKQKSLTDSEIQNFLGHEIDYKIGFDAANVEHSIDEGKPLAAIAPRAAMSLGLKTIADRLAGNDYQPLGSRWGRLRNIIRKS